MNDRINCFNCKHYYVTWDPQASKGCKAHNFKTNDMPNMIVKHSSGQDCLCYELKLHKRSKKALDLNDKDLW